jgi:hypothetical protein
MKRVDFPPGEDVHNAAKWLVANAPATTLFNGVQLTAEAVDVNPDDVVRQYWRGMAEKWPDNAAYYNEQASAPMRYPGFACAEPIVL